MNRGVRRKLAAERRKIEQRQESAVRINKGGPALKGNGIRYELADTAAAIACGGIGAIHQMVRELGLQQSIDDALHLLLLEKGREQVPAPDV